jgi:hypothetical protein
VIQSDDQGIMWSDRYLKNKCHTGEGSNTQAMFEYDVLKNPVQYSGNKGAKCWYVDQGSYMV